METVKWFDRKFDFQLDMAHFPGLLERLENSPSKFLEATGKIPELDLNFKPRGKWSIKEHIGHLCVLEPLWQKRFLEIKENSAEMSPADLQNTATNEALFDQYNLEEILRDFQQQRKGTIQLLKRCSGEEFRHSLRHPRLQQPMRIIDLMYFVAEHDGHHLENIQNTITALRQIKTVSTQKDIQRCTQVILELRPHLKGKDLWQQYRKQSNESYRIMYIQEGEKAVSFIGYRLLNMLYSGKTLYIDDLCTLPENSGKGHAGLLLDRVFNIAKGEGCETVSLDSGHHRHTAHRLYLNKGFDISSHHFQMKPKGK